MPYPSILARFPVSWAPFLATTPQSRSGQTTALAVDDLSRCSALGDGSSGEPSVTAIYAPIVWQVRDDPLCADRLLITSLATRYLWFDHIHRTPRASQPQGFQLRAQIGTLHEFITLSRRVIDDRVALVIEADHHRQVPAAAG